jgi:hypothetical protein
MESVTIFINLRQKIVSIMNINFLKIKNYGFYSYLRCWHPRIRRL